jgi:hypothetical protein
LDKLILEVYVRQTLGGPQIAFRWPPLVREGLRRFDLMPTLGEALATFGEQLKMDGLGLTKQGPALVYGPDGKPVA